MDNEKKQNQFMNFVNDPTQAINTNKFNLISSGFQFVGLIVFAVIGASISFRFDGLNDLLDPNYWISVVVMLGEQLYAYNIGYNLGRGMMLNSNEELKRTNNQIKGLIEGVYETKGEERIEKVRPLKKDSHYVGIALKELTEEDKIELVKKRMREIIKLFESKLSLFKSYNKKRWLFPKIIKITKKQRKPFWNCAKAIKYCENQIEYGKAMLEDNEAILAVPDSAVQGYQKLEYANIMSSQDEIVADNVSKYHQRSESKEKAKKAGMKAFKKFIISTLGVSIIFGAVGGDQALGYIVYTIVIMLLQVVNGFKFGSDMVIKILLYNSTNRLKALQDIKDRIPKIKEKEKIEKIEAKENEKLKHDSNTTEILPTNLIKKYNNILSAN